MRKEAGLLMGIVADDVTGSNDIGIMFAKAGLLTHVYTAIGPGSYAQLSAGQPSPDVCILNTSSRLDSPQTAYEKVFVATRELQAAGCRQFFNKTCSVFRGNIGPEFDAMLDALGLDFAVVVLGFPKNGRTTMAGIHYVRGVRLEDSEFKHDPVHPMTRSDLVGILQSQTLRKVDLLTWQALEQGAESLRREIERMRAQCNYLILDVRSQSDLAVIAQAVRDEPVLCGSSALGEELPAAWGVSQSVGQSLQLPPAGSRGVLCLSGSLMPQTAVQIQAMQACGAEVLTLDSALALTPAGLHAQRQRLVLESLALLSAGRDVILHSGNLPAQIDAVHAAGDRLGLSRAETSRRVSSTLAQIGAEIMRTAGLSRLIVAGGETSAAVCAELGINGLRIWQEIEPGVPSCISLSNPPLFLVLKSGSFGSPEFLVKAAHHIRLV